MRTNPWAWAVGVAFVVGALLGWRVARPPVTSGPSADSLALEQERADLARRRAALTDRAAALAALGEQLTRDMAAAAARASAVRAPLPPRPADPAPANTEALAWQARADSIERRLVEARLALDSAEALQARTMTAYRGAVESASQFAVLAMRAEGALSQAAHRVGHWQREASRRTRWSAGPMMELGRLTPVGGYIDRDVGPFRVQLSVTDGAQEPLTGRAAVGLRW